jgi:hypothetical protein
MIRDKPINPVFSRKESRAAHRCDAVKRCIYPEGIGCCEKRARDFDPPDLVIVDDRLNGLAVDPNYKNSLFHSLGALLLGIADDFASLPNVRDSHPFPEITNPVVCKYSVSSDPTRPSLSSVGRNRNRRRDSRVAPPGCIV